MDYALLRKMLVDFLRVDSPPPRRVPVLTVAGDNSRSVLYRGKRYSPLVDTLGDDLAARNVACLSVARIISAIRGAASHGEVYAPDGAFTRALLQKRLVGLTARGRYPYSRWEEEVWGRILDATGARKVVGIQPSRELCVACHKRGVWVSDLQHGVIADLHPWYGSGFRAHEPKEYLPHAFLCWDRGSENVIGKWAHERDIRTHVVGHPWLTRFALRGDDDPLVRELSERHESALRSIDGRKTILLSLSWGESNIPNGFVAEGVEKAIRASAREWRWLIRLHPNQLSGFAKQEGVRFADYFRARLKGFAEWEPSTHSPLPVLLRHVDLHVTWSSSVCIEASQMGIKSALLNPRLRMSDPYFGLYQESGMVELVSETEDEILKWIRSNSESRKAPSYFDEAEAEYRRIVDFLCA
jgi:hypothetical protein